MEGRIFDAAFVVMPYHKLKAALPEIVKLQASLLVLVGNDVTLAEMEKHIKENAPGVKKILFGFQATGGKKEEDRYICERLGGGMDIGQLHGEASPTLKKWVRRMFEGTDYKLNWQADGLFVLRDGENEDRGFGGMRALQKCRVGDGAARPVL